MRKQAQLTSILFAIHVTWKCALFEDREVPQVRNQFKFRVTGNVKSAYLAEPKNNKISASSSFGSLHLTLFPAASSVTSTPLHVLLHYMHESSLLSSSSPPAQQLHIQHPLSSMFTVPPLHMSRQSQPGLHVA